MDSNLLFLVTNSLLTCVEHEIRKHKKIRPFLTIIGIKDYLVGIVEFTDIHSMMITKLLLEYMSEDYKFVVNDNLYLTKNGFTALSKYSLEIYITGRKLKKVETFLKFLEEAKSRLGSIITHLQGDWIRLVQTGSIIYLRKNIYLCHQGQSIHPSFVTSKEVMGGLSTSFAFLEKNCQGEDVFWRHVLSFLQLDVVTGGLDQDIGMIKIEQGLDKDQQQWNYIVITPNYQNKIERGLGLNISAEAESMIDVIGAPDLV